MTFLLRASLALATSLFATAALADEDVDGGVELDASPPTPEVAPVPVPVPVAKAPEKKVWDHGTFEFGSYGRVRVASDLRGGWGRVANVVAYGTRIDEDSYAELELRREDQWKDDIKTKVVATLALFAPFFHFTGQVDQMLAVRNLYAQGTIGKLNIWIGSRMYRGDDIYLLNWWPLDNQNTLGGGAGYQFTPDTIVSAHVGMQRLENNQYQSEVVPVVAPLGATGTVNVQQLDRPRIIETLKLVQLVRNGKLFRDPKAGFKFVLYGEAHEISAGVYQDPQTSVQRGLPQDYGFLVGAQMGLWSGERDTHVNLFLRHARGLAAYDPLAAPLTFANDRTTMGSTETLIALGGNFEKKWFGLLGGAYLRFFRDGDPAPTSTQKYDEGTLVLRPQVYLGEHWGIAAEGSFQARRYGFPDPENNSSPLTASLWRFGVMPYFSPAGRGSFVRPQFRIVYVATLRNRGAQELYPVQYVYNQRDVEHFLGLNVEWWFNSSSYP
jgi:hypothetical protein